jgi:hypothetical protein
MHSFFFLSLYLLSLSLSKYVCVCVCVCVCVYFVVVIVVFFGDKVLLYGSCWPHTSKLALYFRLDLNFLFIYFFGGSTKGFALAMQVLYCLSHAPTLFYSCYREIGSRFLVRLAWTIILLSCSC